MSSLVKPLNKFGKNGSVSTAEVDISPVSYWRDSGDLAVALEVLSSDAADVTDGTGARTVQFYGVDGDFDEISEQVSLAGTSPVALTNNYARMFRAKVLTAGSGGAVAGTLTLRTVSGATSVLNIDDLNQTLIAAWTVPKDYHLAIHAVSASVLRAAPQNEAADVKLKVREFGGVWQVKHLFSLPTGSAPYRSRLDPPLRVPAKADVKMTAQGSAAGFEVTGWFDGRYRHVSMPWEFS
jgi:hypothetical protein